MAIPNPKPDSVTRHEPQRGKMRHTTGWGWQYGDPPKPPAGLLAASREAWKTWMGAWFAANWSPEDLPGLRIVIRLYDLAERGEKVSSDLRQMMDTYGITPKGQQDRRWLPPKEDAPERPASTLPRLKVVDE